MADEKKEFHLYQCSQWRCNHLWIDERLGDDSYGFRRKYKQAACPACKANASHNEKILNVDPTHEIALLTPPTYAKTRFHNEQDVVNYPTDAVLDFLAVNGFKRAKSPNKWDYDLDFRKKDGSVVKFEVVRSRSTTDMYVLLPKNSPLLDGLKDAIKKAKEQKKINAAKPKPYIEGMMDTANQDLKVGDYVAYWATKSLEFGKIKEFVKVHDGKWNSTGKVTAAKVVSLKGIIIPTPKLKTQLFLLPEDRALLLMLER